MKTECPYCNTLNPPQAVTCRVCNLSLPKQNAPATFMQSGTRPKMAVFDLDKTIFDLSRRERAARRQGLKAGSKKWYEFLNQNKYILMDTPMPGTASFIRELSENGYTIAYLSGRPRHTLAATKQSLQENGFPIDAMEQDLVFLHSGKGSIRNITNHKKSVLTHLKKVFDIDFFFDDTPEFREAAKSLFIPGVYPSIAAYTGKEERQKGKSKKARKNPGHGDDLCHRTTAIDPNTGIYYACSKPEGHDGPHDFSIEMVSQDATNFDEDNPFDNPVPPKSRFEQPMTCSNGHEFTMGEADKKKILGAPKYESISLRCPICGEKAIFTNPVSSAFAEDFAYEQPSLENPQIQRPRPRPQQSGSSTAARCRRCGTQLGTAEARRRGCPNCVISNPVPKPRKKRDKAGRMRKEQLKNYIDRFMGDKKMNEEFPDRSQRFAVAATTARKFYGDKAVDKAYPRDNPRTNPHTPVHEAKSFYKKFHQKPAKNVKNVKVDIGDTWVGLGKAWSIGYRSGKETGNDQQKYIHNFGVDEESGKQFKEPELYYVKNNDGSQMMVIMGGDWYIDVDEAGQMSWIYI